MPSEITSKQLRSFGFTVGGIFAVIALWPLIVRSEDPRWWAMVVAGCLLVPGVVFPRSLVWVYRGWMAVGHIMGWINTRIILGFVLCLIVIPIGMLGRCVGGD